MSLIVVSEFVNIYSVSIAKIEVSSESDGTKFASALTRINKYTAVLLQAVLPLHLEESIARAGAGLRRTLELLPLPQIAANTKDLHQQAAR